MERWGLPLISNRQLDDGACDWADFQFLDGGGFHVGEMPSAALDAWASVSWERGGLPLSRYKRVLRSWKTNAPKQSRLPMPEEFVFLISAALCHHHSVKIGLYLIALFCTYLRPSALLNLHLEDIVKPVRQVAGEH